MLIFESGCPEDTFGFGSRMAEKAMPGAVITLNGDLGAGKTVFTKGFAHGLGISELVTSPTFTILQEYSGGRIPLYHFDAYRIEDPDEMEEVGLDHYLYGSGVCIIEWAEIIRDILPENTISVTIEKDPGKGTQYRRIITEGI